LGNRVCNILKYLFPVPKEDSKRVLTFANTQDYISFRHHVFVQTSKSNVELAEVGPRFEMKVYEIKLGTVDQTDADVEWVLKPYMNTSKKRQVL
jgi:U3 small nucleolar ribonucleoprotein protein IMP4